MKRLVTTIVCLLALAGLAEAACTNTPNLSLCKQAFGDPNWDVQLNANFDKLDFSFTSPLSRSGTTISLGTVTETKGGTGETTYTVGDTLYSDAANSLAKLAGNTTTTKKYLTQTGNGSISAAPVWNALAAADLPSGFLDAVADISSALGTDGQTFIKAGGIWTLGGVTGQGTVTSVEEGNVLVGAATAVSVDFQSGFDVVASSTDRDVSMDLSEVATGGDIAWATNSPTVNRVRAGATPATAGEIRLSHNNTIRGRNSANSADRTLFDWGAVTDELQVGSGSANTRIRTNLATPTTLADGDWWVECSGTTPTRTCSIIARDTGASRTIATGAAF